MLNWILLSVALVTLGLMVSLWFNREDSRRLRRDSAEYYKDLCRTKELYEESKGYLTAARLDLDDARPNWPSKRTKNKALVDMNQRVDRRANDMADQLNALTEKYNNLRESLSKLIQGVQV